MGVLNVIEAEKIVVLQLAELHEKAEGKPL